LATKKKPKVATLDDVGYLLEKADNLIKKAKKDHKKAKAVCKACNSAPPYHLGLCKPCYDEKHAKRINEKEGTRWISTNNQEMIYVDGKPRGYAKWRMEQILGRELFEFEMVTRIDGDSTNNADNNLLLVAKPGFNLTTLACEGCGRHYFNPKETTNEEV
jgi:hypothetical protein